MKSSFVTVAVISLLGNFIQQPTANVSEDGTVDVDEENIRYSKQEAKGIRTVAQGGFIFIVSKNTVRNLNHKKNNYKRFEIFIPND